MRALFLKIQNAKHSAVNVNPWVGGKKIIDTAI